MRAAALALAAVAVSPQAHAQESFELNTVLVATFEAVQPFLDPEAERVRGLVESALASQYVVLTMADVPAFADTTAEVYLRSCPDGQYVGCVFVVGGRAKTDWVVGGRVSAVDGGFKVDLSFIDVDIGKLVMEADVTLDGANDAQFQEGVVKIVDALVAGGATQLVPNDPAAEAAAAAEQRAAQAAAADFSTGTVYQAPVDGGATPPPEATGSAPTGRVTSADLAAMASTGVPPWEKVGLKKAQYKLYRNSGAKLDVFRDRMMGRKGQMLVSFSGQVGTGPWGQQHDTWYLIDDEADPRDVRQRDILHDVFAQVQTRAPLSMGGQLALDFGLASFVELGLFGGMRQAPYAYRFRQQVDGGALEDVDYTSRGVLSWYGGLRLGFIPFPAYPVRPRLHVGGSFWYGTKLQSLVAVPDYLLASQSRPNTLVLAHVNPGVEVSAGKWVLVWTRFDLDIPLLGRNPQQFQADNPRGQLSDVPPADTDKGFALGASLGLSIRIPIGAERRGL